MKAVIQCAMALEAEPFLGLLPADHQVTKIGNQEFHVGVDKQGSELLISVTGIGLANAAAGTARALTLFEPEVVIAAGTTGGLHVDIEVGDIAAGSSAIYSLADATEFGYAPGQIPGMPVDYSASEVPELAIEHKVRRGPIVSADAFVTTKNVGPVRERFPDAIATDMETAAMAQTCWAAGVPWVTLRAVSDLCGPAAGQDFHIDAALAARCSFDAVVEFLRVG